MDADKFDIIVSDISFVVCRKIDKGWRRTNLVNKQNFLLVYTVDGQSDYEVGGRHFSISKGDMLFFNKGQAHSSFPGAEYPWAYCTVAFDAENLDPQDFPLLTHTVSFEFCGQLCKTLNEEWTAKKPGYRLLCRGIISELLCVLLREKETGHKKNSAIEKVRQHIAENFTNDFTVGDLAAMAGVSAPHFHRLFKENTGLSAKRYLNAIRINKACDLLRSGEHNITEVAYTVGFRDIYYFSRLFKKLTGVPPSKSLNKSEPRKPL